MAAEPNRVFLCSGHMIDAPGRKEARFPPAKEAAVRRGIAAQLARWNGGERDVGICGGACPKRGTDKSKQIITAIVRIMTPLRRTLRRHIVICRDIDGL